MNSFWLVMVMGNPGTTVEDIQAHMAGAGIPWCRIANNVWIVHTARSAPELSSLMMSIAQPSGNFFCSRLALGDHSGLLPQIVWDWIASKGSIAG